MRRKKCEVTDIKGIENILAATNIGRMATNGPDGYPYVTPVNFVYLSGNIYFHSAREGEKLDNITRNPHVCFEVDIPLAYIDSGFDPDHRVCQVHQFYYCVIIRGQARVLEDGPLKIESLNALVKKHEHQGAIQRVDKEMEGYKACAVVEIKPDSISAKSDLWQYKPLEVQRRLVQYLKNRKHVSDLDTIVAVGFDDEKV
jgi:uncharacterized protein